MEDEEGLKCNIWIIFCGYKCVEILSSIVIRLFVCIVLTLNYYVMRCIKGMCHVKQIICLAGSTWLWRNLFYILLIIGWNFYFFLKKRKPFQLEL
jgi:hypothetical protein